MASSSTWTAAQNKRFETAVAMLNKDTPYYWGKVASAVGDQKTVEEVKTHYEKLVEDVRMIEQDLIPLPNYTDAATARGKSTRTKSKAKGRKN